MRKLALLSIVAVALASRLARAEERLTVERAIELALANNVDLAVLQSDARAAEARLSGASLLLRSNPQLSGSLGVRWQAQGTIPEYDAELTQEVEVLGQRGARIDVARAGVETVDARFRARRVEVAAEVRQAFARALAADQLALIARENVELVRQTASAAAKRFEVGDGSRIEVNTANIEVGRAAREQSLALRQSVGALAALRTLLGLDPTLDVRLDGELQASSSAVGELSTLVQRASEGRADLLAARRAVEGARASAVFEGRDWLPRPRIGARYEQEEGEQVALATLSFDLPFINRNQEGRGVAAAQLTQAERILEATERRVRQEVALAVSNLRAAQETVEAFEGAVNEAARENLTLVNTAYAAGKVDLVELLVIRRNALEARRNYVEALEALRIAEAELGRAVGSDRGLP